MFKSNTKQISSDHPFNDIYYVHEGWWGEVELPSTFGLCDLSVDEDENAVYNEGEEYLPANGQYKLYDFFAANQERMFPLIHKSVKTFFMISVPYANMDFSFIENHIDNLPPDDTIKPDESQTGLIELLKIIDEMEKANAKKEMKAILDNADAISKTKTFEELNVFFDNTTLRIGTANNRGKGQIFITYYLKDTDTGIIVPIQCNPFFNLVSVGKAVTE